mmetsp:Transcript_30525/g.37604  ORF Transcript_30525/g.37604 Transcript_30525/m.37604 type:complete len:138 (+) Transcript_30525:1102-1515(+)
MPSQTSMLFRQHGDKRTEMQATNLQSLYAKYGGEKHMSLPEHVKAGSKIEPENVNVSTACELTGLVGIATKYNENVLDGTHTAVWGSWFCSETKKWGFKCCMSTDKTALKCKAALASKAPILKKAAAPATQIAQAED